MAPAGAVGLAGAGVGLLPVVGGDNVGLCLGVGKLGSVGPAPGAATGLPSMVEPQPETNTEPASKPASTSEPPARLRRAFSNNRTRCSPKISECQRSGYALRGASCWGDAVLKYRR